MTATLRMLNQADQHWSALATCRWSHIPTDLFFDQDREDEAIAICRTCPVREQCIAAEAAEFAASSQPCDQVFGVRGGLTAEQRLPLLLAVRPDPATTTIDTSATVADQAAALGVSKRTLQRRRAAARLAA